MGLRLPLDIEEKLQQKYSEVHIKSLIENIFQEILDKTLNDGACTIKGIGKFISFVTYSKRVGGKIVRFKFRPSQALIQSIRKDEYLLKNLPVQAQVPFTEEHQKICDENKNVKKANEEAAINASKKYVEKKMEYKVANNIIEILQKDQDG